jgi:hypothetical protein
MKTTLKVSDHTILPGEKVVEIWWMDRLIGQITGADGPGVRIFSKYAIRTESVDHERATPITVVELKIGDA